MDSLEIVKIAANAANKKKAVDIAALKIGDLTVLCEYFLICSATSSTHVRALCDEVEDTLMAAGIKPYRIEGRATGWVALDYGSVIVHIFTRKEREFYGLDKMWSDAEAIDLNDILEETEGD